MKVISCRNFFFPGVVACRLVPFSSRSSIPTHNKNSVPLNLCIWRLRMSYLWLIICHHCPWTDGYCWYSELYIGRPIYFKLKWSRLDLLLRTVLVRWPDLCLYSTVGVSDYTEKNIFWFFCAVVSICAFIIASSNLLLKFFFRVMSVIIKFSWK